MPLADKQVIKTPPSSLRNARSEQSVYLWLHPCAHLACIFNDPLFQAVVLRSPSVSREGKVTEAMAKGIEEPPAVCNAFANLCCARWARETVVSGYYLTEFGIAQITILHR